MKLLPNSITRNSQQITKKLTTSQELNIGKVAHILELIATQPNRRNRPQKGDIKGDFHAWFDGGAVRVVTGYTVYEFTDGTRVTTHTLPYLNFKIEFCDGICIDVVQAG